VSRRRKDRHQCTPSPFGPEGNLARPIDIFDLVMHATPLLLVALKLWRQLRPRRV
jgi:hypothetical protein